MLILRWWRQSDTHVFRYDQDKNDNIALIVSPQCARLVGAKHNILIHLKPGESIRKKAEKWAAPNKLILEPGQEIDL